MKTTQTSVSGELLGKLTRYTTLAGAVGLGAGLAEAGIVVWTSGETATAPVNGFDSLFFDFETGNVQHSSFTGADFQLFVINRTNITPSVNSFSIFALYSGADYIQGTNVHAYASRLASGEQINATQTFVDSAVMMAGGRGTGSVRGKWSAGGQGYLGLKFDINGGTYYGWADVTLENILPTEGLPKITLHRFGYNTEEGQGLTAGQTVVPEPESLLPMALLALGAAGLTRYRRQRVTQAAGNDA